MLCWCGDMFDASIRGGSIHKGSWSWKKAILFIWFLHACWPQSFEGYGSSLPPGTLFSPLRNVRHEVGFAGLGHRTWLLLRLYFMSCEHESSLLTRSMATRCLTPVRSVVIRLHFPSDTIEVVPHAACCNIVPSKQQ